MLLLVLVVVGVLKTGRFAGIKLRRYCRPQTPNPKSQTQNPKPSTASGFTGAPKPVAHPQNQGGAVTVVARHESFLLRVLSLGFIGSWVWDLGFRGSGLGVLGFGLRIWGVGLGGSDLSIYSYLPNFTN